MTRLMLASIASLLAWPQEGAPPPAGATVLFDGKNATLWVADGDKPVPWPVVDGALEVGKGSIVTREKYRDFQLHLEFMIPPSAEGAKGQAKGNSGIYIQRRYEIQILDSHGAEPPGAGDCGALYRQKAPDRNACGKAGGWQAFDITFRSPRWDAEGKKSENGRITVVHNGVKIHDHVEIKGKTGAGQAEGPEPGPILLQEHGAKVRFRNIWIVAM